LNKIVDESIEKSNQSTLNDNQQQIYMFKNGAKNSLKSSIKINEDLKCLDNH